MGSYYPPTYVNADQKQGYDHYGQQQPPSSYNPPPLPSEIRKADSRKKCCLCCVCCICWFLFLVFLVCFGIFVYFTIHMKPQTPTIDVTDVAVKRFDIKDNILETDMAVSIEVNNFNTEFSLLYGKGSELNVKYGAVKICKEGWLPEFEQPAENITKINNIGMQGKMIKVDQEFQDSFLKSQKNGRIPLRMKILVPWRFSYKKVGYKMKKDIKFVALCHFEVESLKVDQKNKILEQRCNFVLNVIGD